MFGLKTKFHWQAEQIWKFWIHSDFIWTNIELEVLSTSFVVI